MLLDGTQRSIGKVLTVLTVHLIRFDMILIIDLHCHHVTWVESPEHGVSSFQLIHIHTSLINSVSVRMRST